MFNFIEHQLIGSTIQDIVRDRAAYQFAAELGLNSRLRLKL